MESELSTPPLGSKLWQPISGSMAVTVGGHAVLRNAGVSYDDTFFPPTIRFELPAAEK